MYGIFGLDPVGPCVDVDVLMVTRSFSVIGSLVIFDDPCVFCKVLGVGDDGRERHAQCFRNLPELFIVGDCIELKDASEGAIRHSRFDSQ